MAAKIDMRFLVRVGSILLITTAFAADGAEPSERDLLAKARAWRESDGLVAARNKLIDALAREDSDNGTFEQRIWLTNRDKMRLWPDCVANCSPNERERTGVFVLLGYMQRNGRSQKLIRHVVETLRSQGWHAKLIEVPEWSSPAEDTAAVHRAMQLELPTVERALLVGFSKGGWVWIHWLQGPARSLPVQEREKIQLLVNFAAILRGSAVADWAAHDTGPEATAFRAIMLARYGIKGASTNWLNSLSIDPWTRQNAKPLRTTAPHLRTIEFVSIPEGRDGQTHANGFFDWTSFSSSHWQHWMSPVDGMVESAAEIPPPADDVPKWIVRVFGSHALLDGHYLNGGVVSRLYQTNGRDWWKGGDEVMDDLLRALPRSTIGW